MQVTQKISNDIIYVGASDKRLSLFENLFPIPRGVSYNSYIIKDNKTALIDTVDYSVSRVFLENIKYILNGKKLDYIIINHMEPDHAASLQLVLEKYPDAVVVGTAKTMQMLAQFFENADIIRTQTVKEGDFLSLGKHELRFFTAPMVHWPEVMVTYDSYEKILFSADAFGTFGSLNGNIFNDEYDINKDWIDDYRRYYSNICGKYGAQVQALLTKALALDIYTICPLHGPVWRNNLKYIINKYELWSKYEPEERAVLLIYASIYGNTENAAYYLANELAQNGVRNIAMYDVSSTDVSELISEVFRCSHIIIMSSTYNLGIYPKMHSFINDMQALAVSNRTFAVIDNGTWAPTAGKKIREELEKLKDVAILENTLTVKSTLKDSDTETLKTLAGEISGEIKG